MGDVQLHEDLASRFAQVMGDASTVFESEDRLVIALDFGTTFSGVAYAFADPNKKPELVSIMDWPGLEGHSQPKVPTLIYYDPADKKSFSWGGQVDWKSDSIQGVKLLLDPDQERPLYIPTGNIKSDLKKLPKPPVEVAADFIGAIYAHALSKIETVKPRDYVLMCQKQFVLSVPAVWSDKAKDTTLRAAKQAGIHPVTLIKEPEAAALYTLHVQERALSVGDAFVLCDAGGGTVDLISYEIVTLSPALELKELVPGTGGMAGSLGLNKLFAEAVKNLVGEDQWYHLRKTKGWNSAQDQFDKSVKLAFRGKADEDYFINFPMAELEDDPAQNLKSSTWNLTGEGLQKIFAPLITDILRLIEDQVKSVQLNRQGKGIKGIFLVGGFGSSQYLKSCVEKEHPDIQVIQPHDAWAAIVKGAALSRLPQQASVVSTQATRHYGVSALSVFDPAIDKNRPSKVDTSDGITRCLRMTWYIYIGEELKRDQKVKFPFYRTLENNYSPSDLVFTDELIESKSKSPPTHPTDGETKSNCSLKADLRAVNKSNFVKRIGVDGNTYYDVHYELVVTTKSANMNFSLEINGREMGSIEANYG